MTQLLKDLYPSASLSGEVIPMDIMSPKGLTRKSFISSAGSISINLQEDSLVCILYATEDCIISFSGTASIPADGVYAANTMFLDKGVSVSIHMPTIAISVIGVSAAGYLYIQQVYPWTATIDPTRRR